VKHKSMYRVAVRAALLSAGEYAGYARVLVGGRT
jgi:hypothetical protein